MYKMYLTSINCISTREGYDIDGERGNQGWAIPCFRKAMLRWRGGGKIDGWMETNAFKFSVRLCMHLCVGVHFLTTQFKSYTHSTHTHTLFQSIDKCVCLMLDTEF